MRWTEHFSAVEAGTCINVHAVVARVVAAEDQKSVLLVGGAFGQMPTLHGYHRAIANSKAYSAPGPDGIGPGVH